MGKFADVLKPETVQAMDNIKKVLPKTSSDRKIQEQRTKANIIVASVPDTVKTDSNPIKTILRKKEKVEENKIISSDITESEKLVFPGFQPKDAYFDSMLTTKGLVYRYYKFNRKQLIEKITFQLRESLKNKSLFDKVVERQIERSFDSIMLSAFNKATEEKITRKEITEYISKNIEALERVHFDNFTYLDI